MLMRKIIASALSGALLAGALPVMAIENGVTVIDATKTAQWTANGKGDDSASKYDLLISHYSANYYQTAYVGFDLEDDFNPAYVQSAKLKLTTTKLSTSVTANVYAAEYDGFDNGGGYETSANAPAYDSTAISTVTSAAVGETAECDVTDYLKGLETGEDAAFRISYDGKGYTGWFIGSCTNDGDAPQLEIEYDNGEGAHTVPESIEYEHGKVTFDNPGSYEAGESITLTVVPDEHYALDTLTIGDETVDVGDGGTYTFSMPARNVSENYIKAVFKLNDYMVTRNIYEDNMLLQRDKPVYIDGTCQNIGSAAAYLYKDGSDAPIQTRDVTIADGEWSVTLDAVSDYSSVYKISVVGDNGGVEMDNVLFGDVFLFTGQSNMWKEVSYYKNKDSDYSQANVETHLTDKIRVMYTKGSGTYGDSTPQYDAKSKDSWRDFSSYSNVSPLPAAAFSAAVNIYEENGNIPVGVIANAYPGSYISCWFPNTGIDSCNSNRSKSSNERNWYNGRIYPIRNLKLSGIFWYQGESDAATTYSSEHEASGYPTDQYSYYKQMLNTLIDDWRELFGDDTLPFYWVQLTRLGTGTTDENNPEIGSDPETTVKKAETDVYLERKDKTNLGVIGTLDIFGCYERADSGNNANCRDDIHPAQKRLVGERMANYALRDIYGKDVAVSGPVPKQTTRSGSDVVVSFDCTGKLAVMASKRYADTTTDEKITNGEIDPSKLNEFRLAGSDNVWYAAEAGITADNEITVHSDDVTEPVYVSYAAKNDYPDAPNLTDDTNLPSYVFEMAVQTAQPIETAIPSDVKCVKVEAEYNDDGTLKNVATTQVPMTEAKKEDNTTTHKIFYWDSLENMVPVAVAAATETPVATATPIATKTPAAAETPVVTATPLATVAPDDYDYSFDFGEDGIGADTIYAAQDDGLTYGFVGVEGAELEDVSRFDGFRYYESDGDMLAVLKNSGNSVETDYSAYGEDDADRMRQAEMPVRFAVDGESGGYYTIEATVKNTSDTEEAEVSLFSELKHYILYKRTLAPGETVTKTFNVHLADTYVSTEGTVSDGVINVCASGRNAGLVSVKIKKNETVGKTVWLITDSTGADQLAHTPTFGLQNYGGTGQALSKYINPDIAVSNQGEGGLDTSNDTNHFNSAVSQMKEGDYLYVQLGFNDGYTDVFKKNLDKYYTAAHEKGVKLLIVSPTERKNKSANWDSTNSVWTSSNAGFREAGREFVNEKIADGADDVAFVDVNTLYTEWMNTETTRIFERRTALGFGDSAVSTAAMEYYYRYPRTSGVDSVHENEAGADNAAYLFAQAARATIAEDSESVQAKVLSELTENAPDETPYLITDDILALGWAPNDAYPYPATAAVEFQYPTKVQSVDTTDGKLVSMTVKVQGDLEKYALGVGEILDADGNTVKTIYTTSTDINATQGHIDNTAVEFGDIVTMYFDGSENDIPDGGSYEVYLLPIDNGATEPDSEPYYSSVYTEPAEVTTKLITSADSTGSEMFDYSVDDGESIVGQGANTTSGAVKWQYSGSAGASTTKATDGDITAAHLYSNGSGSYALTKYFNNYNYQSDGLMHIHFQIKHTYGSFGINLTNVGKISSWMGSMRVLSIEDETLKVYGGTIPDLKYDADTGTEVGKIKPKAWTDVDIWLDLDRGTETVSVAGGDKTTVDIPKLMTSSKTDAETYLPLKGLCFSYTVYPSTLPSYSFDTLVTDVSVDMVETDTPQVNITAAVDDACAAMGTVTGGGVYDINSDVTLTAVPNEDYNLEGWYTTDGELYSTETSLTLERVREDIALTAKFTVQHGKDAIASFDIKSDKSAVKVGSTMTLTPENCKDSDGNATVAAEASDISWSSSESGVTISSDGVMSVGEDFEIDANTTKTVTVTGTINDATATKDVTVYSYAYYDVIGDDTNAFDGTVMTLAEKSAIVFPAAKTTSTYTLNETITLEGNMRITYSNAWGGSNTAGQNRTLAFKDSSGTTVFSMYYSWTDLYFDSDTKVSAFTAKNTWSDIVTDIDTSTGVIKVTSNGNEMQTTVDISKLTDIAAIELTSAASCPGPGERPLGISAITVEEID